MVTHAFATLARRTALALALAALGSAGPGLAAINWPGGGTDDGTTTQPTKDYEKGFTAGEKACREEPVDCGVMLEDTVGNLGWGETEPNDHIGTADWLKPGLFYRGNTMDGYDVDWYYITTDAPNQNLVISFLGDQANYTDTSGWIIDIHDAQGNVIASFDSTPTGTGNVTRDPTDPLELAKVPLTLARSLVHTLGAAGRYYISVRSNELNGAERAYHIAAMISASDQVAANPDTNFHDTETEPNDDRSQADPLRSNVHMYGTFGRRMVTAFSPAEQQQTEIVYRNCNPADLSTIPVGLDSCQCDPTAAPFPANPTLPPPSAYDPLQACEEILVGDVEGKWIHAYDYDNDWFYYQSQGNEQLILEMCAQQQCDFARVHLHIYLLEEDQVLFNGPIQPGWRYDLGLAAAGTYYIELSPEPVDGPEVDPATGIHTVDDLTGPYNFIIRSTGLPPHGGN